MEDSVIKRHVARRFVIYIVLLSTLITIITTAVQLFFDYRRDIAAIETHIEQIRSSHLESIRNSVWVEDEKQIVSQLQGLVRYVDMELISIKVNDATQWQAGETRSKRTISRNIPLVRHYRGKNITIGELHIVASIDNVVNRLIDKAIVILVTNAMKTFIVAGFIYLLFHYLVARHLFQLGEWARSFKLNARQKPVTLDRHRSVANNNDADEFDAVTAAMNEMLYNIQQSYGELQDSHNSLEKQAMQSQRTLNLHLEKTPLAAITWDRNLKCVEWNKSAERIFGYTRDEAIGRRALDLIVPQQLHADMLKLFDALFNQQGGSHSVNENVTSNGVTILCEWFNTPITSDEGKPVAIASLAQDVTVQHRYETELVVAKEEAEKANRSKSEFLSSMSHELRTPLNAILGFGQLLEMVLDDEVQKNNASEIIKAGNHLLGLINDILDLSKIEAGKMEWSMRDVHLNAVIKECLALIQPLADKHEVQLIDQITSKSDYILRVDYKRCKQVLLNLLSNAVKYNKPGGNVSLSCEVVTKGKVRIGVTDTGPGISDQDLPLLFEPFNRLDADYSNVEGTGIGLLITKQLVELMWGHLDVESVLGEGSTFWVELNISSAITAVPGVEYSEDSTRIEESGSVPVGDINILVAEDNLTNQEVLRQQLNLLGYTAEFANDGVEALQMWQSGDYQLLLTDVHMPNMDGYELVRNMQQTDQYADNRIPIIAITADAMEGQAQRCLDAGMDDYVAKPVDIDELQETLNRWLSQTPEAEKQDEDQAAPVHSAGSNKSGMMASAGGPVDHSTLTRLVGDDPARHRQLLKTFVNSTPQIIDEIMLYLARRNAYAIVEQSHKLKSSARSIGANKLYEACQMLEVAARNQSWSDIEFLAQELSGLYKEVEGYVETYESQA